ncbi:MAG: type II secretion system protein [Bryobacterales bacterium]|nr:type II secretion system protein [Bryobacterales bacterium]
MRRRRSQFGMSLVELIVAFTIMALLTAMAVPLARFRVRREKERELRYALRELHTAIDKYKDACDKNIFQGKLGSDCYPETLDQLVEGVKIASDASGKKLKFLRRIPKDPFTGSTEWGMRSTQDDPKSNGWGGQNVFAVYTKTMEKSPDGTLYSEW